jgi:UDP-N-acetylmuramoyl-tripeptide--D-alanyl-D-alanine ligase
MIIRNLLYILQSENYNLRRFLSFVFRHYNWWSLQDRQKIDWTAKAKLIYFLSLVFLLALIIYLYLLWQFWALLVLPIIYILLPLIISFVSWIIIPLDLLLKKRVIEKAKSILKECANLKVIGITGSYGKTSAKEILEVILSAKFKTIKTSDNINTDLGISQFIISHKAQLMNSDFFIVEMGAYQKGDIKTICDLVSPDYSILTGINSSHLERFGSLENTISAKFELATETKNLSILNFNDVNIKNNYTKFKIKEVLGLDDSTISTFNILPNFSGLSFVFDGYEFKTKLLAKHNISLIILALSLAKKFGISNEEAGRAIANLDYVAHRLQPIFNNSSQVLVIDDSYNGNLQGIISGLEVLNRAEGRKLVVTPGLVELGIETENVHRQIAHLYVDNKIDLVIIIQNSSTKYIIDEFKKLGFSNYKVYISTQSAHNSLKEILRAGDTIIFQNDWPDNYK